MSNSKPELSNEELKPEVQAALSGGGDERWVLDERGHKIICEDGKLRKPNP